MKIEEATVGTRVTARVEFSGVRRGTEGVIDEDYGTGVMVAWDLPDHPLPVGYDRYDGRPAIVTGITRDGFDKKKELQYLDRVITAKELVEQCFATMLREKGLKQTFEFIMHVERGNHPVPDGIPMTRDQFCSAGRTAIERHFEQLSKIQPCTPKTQLLN